MTAIGFLIGYAAIVVGYYRGDDIGTVLGLVVTGLAFIRFVNRDRVDD